jgi:hypothetical protein
VVYHFIRGYIGATEYLRQKTALKKMRINVVDWSKGQKASDQWQKCQYLLKQAHYADTKSRQYKENNTSYYRAE